MIYNMHTGFLKTFYDIPRLHMGNCRVGESRLHYKRGRETVSVRKGGRDNNKYLITATNITPETPLFRRVD